MLSEDLGSDPVSTAWLGMEHIRTALDSLHKAAEDGRQAADSAFAVTALKKQYRQFVGHAVSHFGGVMRIPDGDGNVVTVPVDSASVSAAAEFVDRFVFNPPSWAGDMTDGDYAAEVRSNRKGGGSLIPAEAFFMLLIPVVWRGRLHLPVPQAMRKVSRETVTSG